MKHADRAARLIQMRDDQERSAARESFRPNEPVQSCAKRNELQRGRESGESAGIFHLRVAACKEVVAVPENPSLVHNLWLAKR